MLARVKSEKPISSSLVLLPTWTYACHCDIVFHHLKGTVGVSGVSLHVLQLWYERYHLARSLKVREHHFEHLSYISYHCYDVHQRHDKASTGNQICMNGI